MRLVSGRRNLRLAVAVLAMVLAPTHASFSKPPTTIPPEVAEYSQAIQAVVNKHGTTSLEAAFEKGLAAADRLRRNELEQLDPATFEAVKAAMLGFIISRDEVIIAAPSSDYFLKLATEAGNAADRAFFAALKMTYPQGYVAAYHQQQTDYSACVDFSNLADVVAAWEQFQRAYPKGYAAAVESELAKLREAVTSTCLCGDREEAEAQLQALQEGSKSDLSRAAANQLAQIRDGKVRFRCQPR